MVAPGTPIVAEASGTAGRWYLAFGSSEFRAALTQELIARGYDVNAVTVERADLSDPAQWVWWQYRATMRIAPLAAHVSLTSIKDDVRRAASDASGYPATVSITSHGEQGQPEPSSRDIVPELPNLTAVSGIAVVAIVVVVGALVWAKT